MTVIPKESHERRAAMVRRAAESGGVSDPELHRALTEAPREPFLAPEFAEVPCYPRPHEGGGIG